LQQLILPIQQVLRHPVIGRQTDLALATLVTERAAACALETLARGGIDPQVYRVSHQQPEHDAPMEQPDAAEHAPRHRLERAEQVQDEILKAAADRHRSERQ
jgi:hypothetical protein